jgi:copper chaperone CopZ
MTTTVLHVTGMTCEHCVNAVRGELSGLPGVTEVSVDLASGRVEVTADGPLDPEAVRTAVDEAGYALAT